MADSTTAAPSRRIAVVGVSGSGKSTYARELSERTGLPLYHMDRLFWRDDWQAVPEAKYLAAHRLLIAEQAWIVEGYIDPAMADRAVAADLIVYLDFPGPLCAWRVFRRWLRYRSAARPELPTAAMERLSLKFLWIVLTRAERPAIEDSLRDIDPSKVRRVRSPSQLARLINP